MGGTAWQARSRPRSDRHRLRACPVYGQRLIDGELRSYALSLDIVAHEITHGITEATAKIEGRGQPGAVNESYSDILGIIVSNFDVPDRSAWDWRMGEDLDGGGVPLRDLSDPGRHGQPDHVDRYLSRPFTREGDFGGIHTNSGIHNRAAYLIMTAQDPQGAELFSARDLAHLFYLALTQHLSRRSGFADSRRGLELSALSLFRDRLPDELDLRVNAVRGAFDAVGVGTPKSA